MFNKNNERRAVSVPSTPIYSDEIDSSPKDSQGLNS